MNDLGKALLNKVDTIIDRWVEEVRSDGELESSKGLTYESIHNGLPDVLASVATLLTAAFADEEKSVDEGAAEHGEVRAEQGFDVTEVVREYRILRNVLLEVLQPDLETGSVAEALKAVREIDSVLDEVVLISLKSYVAHRLSLLEKMQGQLLLTNQELTRLVEIQKDNVSHLAHELKNPLNSIIGFSSILLQKQRKQLTEGDAMPMEMKQVERILSNGRQILRLINNTSEVAKKEADSQTLTPEVVNPTIVAKTVAEAFETAAQEKALSIEINCTQAPEQVTTDSLRLQQILTNLLSNAIRYSDKGTITISCYALDEKQWAIAVKDMGKGISEENQAKIFEPYFRIGDDGTYLPESSGLGLTIVNKLVLLLEGKIELVSAPGKGSTFTVKLPLSL